MDIRQLIFICFALWVCNACGLDAGGEADKTRVEAMVVDQSGQPAVGIGLQLRRESSWGSSENAVDGAITDASGRAVITHKPPGGCWFGYYWIRVGFITGIDIEKKVNCGEEQAFTIELPYTNTKPDTMLIFGESKNSRVTRVNLQRKKLIGFRSGLPVMEEESLKSTGVNDDGSFQLRFVLPEGCGWGHYRLESVSYDHRQNHALSCFDADSIQLVVRHGAE